MPNIETFDIVHALFFLALDVTLIWFTLYAARKGFENASIVWRTLRKASSYIDEQSDPVVVLADQIIETLTKKEFDEQQLITIGQNLKELSERMEQVK